MIQASAQDYEDYVVVAESPDKERVYAGSPGLARLPGGELVASYEWFRAKPLTETVPQQTEVRVSGDRGATWELRAIRFQGIAGNERRILMLIYSADAQNWFQAGCIALSRRMLDAFSYAYKAHLDCG